MPPVERAVWWKRSRGRLLLFDDDRERLRDRACAVEEACLDLRLRLHPWQGMPTRAGVTFVGYRIMPDQVRVKRTTVRRAEERLARLRQSAHQSPEVMDRWLASLRATFAHFSHADTWRLRTQLLGKLGLLLTPEDAEPTCVSEGPGPACDTCLLSAERSAEGGADPDSSDVDPEATARLR